MKRRLGRIFLILPAVFLVLPFLLGMRPPHDGGKKSSSVKIGKGGVRSIHSPRKSREYKPGELLVRFRQGIAANSISTLHARLGTSTVLASRMVPGLQLVKLPKKMSVESAIAEFKRSGLVKYAEPNWKRYLNGTSYPNDPLVQIQPQASTDPLCDGNTDSTGHETEMWDLQMPNQCTSLDPLICASGYTCGGNNAANSDVSVLPCTDPDCLVNETQGAFTDVAATTTTDIIVASIDTGVDYTHPDIAANMWHNPGEVAGNGLDDDQNGIVDDVYGLKALGLGGEGTGCGNDLGDPMDDFFHGSHTTGTMIARANNLAGLVGMAGLSNRVKVLACKAFDSSGSGTDSDILQCFDYVHDQKVNHGQNIIAANNSWGGGPFSQALEDAIAKHRDDQILDVFSAGNAANDNDESDTFPTNLDVDNIISVGAYNQYDCASGFSNYGGRSVDIFAPGSLVASACPWNISGNCSGDPNINYVYASGTSMAAPHVTGLVGMMKAINPSLTMTQLRNLVLTTGVSSTKADSACSSIPTGDDIDAITTYSPVFQSYTGDGTKVAKKSVTDKRIDALKAAQLAASPSGTAGTYNLQAVIFPYKHGGTAQEGVPILIKAINVDGYNVGAAGSVTATVGFQTKSTLFSDSFTTGLPTGWTNTANAAPAPDCGVPWAFDDPGARDLFDDNFAIADSDFQGFCNMDTSLRTTTYDVSACLAGGDNVLLEFANNFNDYFYTAEVADVNVSTDGFTSLTNVLSMSGNDDTSPKSIDISAAIGGSPSTTQVEFRYHDAYYSWWWAIDDFALSCLDATVVSCTAPTFLDDGVYPDQIAGDGIFAAQFTPGTGPCTGTGKYSVDINIGGNLIDTLTFDVAAGAVGPAPTVAPDTLNFAFVPVGQSKQLPIHVTNPGGASFQITGASKASGLDFSFNDFGTTYPITVAPGAKVDGIVTFSPTIGGPLNDTLTINTDAGDLFVDMSGTGVGPYGDIHVTPTSVNFGSGGPGTVRTQDLTVTNNGAADLHISGLDLPDPSLSTTTIFPITVPPSGTTTINVTWTSPGSNATLDVNAVIASDDPDESGVSIHLTASALACAFSDDHESGTIDFSKWTILTNTWTQTGGDMVGSNPTKKAKIIATGFAGCGANCSIHVAMSTTGGAGGKVSVLGWYQNNGNYAEARMDENGDKWQVRHKANGSLKKQTFSQTILPGQVYDVVFAFDGTNFTLAVDGTTIITMPKVSGSNPSGTGGYLVIKSNGNYQFICIQ